MRFRSCLPAGAFALLLACAAVPVSSALPGAMAQPARKSGQFRLHVFEGYRLDTGAVGKSSSQQDLSFTYQVRASGMISYLGAAHIKRFDGRPSAGTLSAGDVAGWKDYVAGPDPGYYVIQARSSQRLYLLHLEKFENQGKAASYWLLTFTWESLGD